MRGTLQTALVMLGLLASTASAQRGSPLLPATRADELLALARWGEAEDEYYRQARPRPREPLARAALGRYLAMRGSLLPGIVLIEEAQEFGLDARIARAMLEPWRTVQRWRTGVRWPTDSVITVRPSTRDTTALFQVPLPSRRRPVWVEVVPAITGYDSTSSPRRIGVEALELKVPSYDVQLHQLVLHGDPRAALRAPGRRYAVLRDERGIWVLVSPGRAVGFAEAMRELGARGWMLDLPHGLVVVR